MKKRKIKLSKNKPTINNEERIHNFKVKVKTLNKLHTSDNDKKSEHESNIILNTNNFKNDIEYEFRLQKKRKRLKNKVDKGNNDLDTLKLKKIKNVLIQSVTCDDNDKSNFTDHNEQSEMKFVLNANCIENSNSDEHNIQGILKKKAKKSNKSVSFNNVPVSTKETEVSPLKKKQKKFKFKKKKKSKNLDGENVDIKAQPEEKMNRNERALTYLKTWKYNREKWKFEKLTQTWILKHMFNAEEIPDDSFQLLLEYIMNIKGSSRNLAMEYSQDVICAMEKKKTDSEENSDENIHVSYQRARSVLQYLQ